MTSDEQAIRNLLFTYAERIDRGDIEGMARLFEHAAYRAGDQPPITDWRAVAHLNQTLVILYEDGTPKTQHDTTNVLIELDPTSTKASARSRFTVLQCAPGQPLQLIVAGRYHDTFEKHANTWRFATRHIFMDLIGDLTKHLRLDKLAEAQRRP
ncbi:MAG: nuclear transport factor 2 family protein [Deltaproteobacteria bacterium]|nr:nuclear transport factor 2 family protein [Deltaproteobacteria bacterium]